MCAGVYLKEAALVSLETAACRNKGPQDAWRTFRVSARAALCTEGAEDTLLIAQVICLPSRNLSFSCRVSLSNYLFGEFLSGQPRGLSRPWERRVCAPFSLWSVSQSAGTQKNEEGGGDNMKGLMDFPLT